MLYIIQYYIYYFQKIVNEASVFISDIIEIKALIVILRLGQFWPITTNSNVLDQNKVQILNQRVFLKKIKYKIKLCK